MDPFLRKHLALLSDIGKVGGRQINRRLFLRRVLVPFMAG